MVLPDVNLLVAASRADHAHHALASETLAAALGKPLELLPVVLAGVLRLVTNARVFVQPTPLAQALTFLDALTAQQNASVTELGATDWRICRQLCEDHQLKANDVPDALIAAAALTRGAQVLTFDRGFARLLPKRNLILLKVKA